MKNLKFTMTAQETQLIFAVLAKAEINSVDGLEKFLACVDILQKVAKEYEDKAQEIVNGIN